MRRAVLRVYRRGRTEEQAVGSHRVAGAGHRNHRRGVASERGHDDRRRDQPPVECPDQRSERFFGDPLHASNFRQWQGEHVRDVGGKVDRNERRNTEEERSRHRSPRVRDLAGAEGQVIPSFVRPHDRDHHDAERGERTVDRRHDRSERRRDRMDRDGDERERGERRDLDHCQRRLDTAAAFDAHIVHSAHRENGNGGHNLSGRDRPCAPRHGHRHHFVARRQCRDEVAEILRKPDRHGRDASRHDDQHACPAKQEGHDRSVCFLEEHIQATGSRIHRAHFRVGEAAAEREHTADHPCKQQQQFGRQRGRHHARRQENCRPDDVRDHHQRGAAEADCADQLRVRIGGHRRGRRVDGRSGVSGHR